MRIRSDWVTGLTVVGLAVCAVTIPRHPEQTQAPAAVAAAKPPTPSREDLAAAGVDYTPVGVARPGKRKLHRQP